MSNTASELQPPGEGDAAAALRPGRRPNAARRGGHDQRGWLVQVLRLVVLAVILGTWQWVARAGWVDSTFTSTPSDIGHSFYHGLTHGTYWSPIGQTLYETLIGFAIGSALGIVVGLAFYQFGLLEAVGRPYMTALNSLPRIALAPLFVLWFGFGSTSRIALAVSLVFFIAAINTYAGLGSCDRDYLILARSLGAGRLELFWKFVLPSAIPTIFAGLQIGLTYSFLGVVAGEMLAGSNGLGADLQLALAAFRTDDFFALLLILVIVSVIASTLMRAIERYLLRWRVIELRGVSRQGVR